LNSLKRIALLSGAKLSHARVGELSLLHPPALSRRVDDGNPEHAGSPANQKNATRLPKPYTRKTLKSQTPAKSLESCVTGCQITIDTLSKPADKNGHNAEGRLVERTRIARDLHDTFLQTVEGSKMVAEDALGTHSDPTPMRRATDSLARSQR
jgi:signal transduction histidine kinase